MDQHKKTCIEFDYTSFLGVTASKRWTFLDAFATIAPIFGLMWKKNLAEHSKPEDRLWDAALNSMSSRHSDESNLVELTRLAKGEGINELRIVMPYSLEPKQIEYIESRGHLKVDTQEQDILSIKL
ncbi:transporter [Vibrio sp. EA2]|uniref:transporter n=1 Tax=Vibrio sp. EA2 TaxID=3079860 RepID=UPI002948DF55|nr:transporter [Vibrio sp. EA2]MDV6250832.1 transporter [Vibrio sp. EA2]